VEIVKAGAGSSATGLSAYIARDARLDHSGDRFTFAHRADELESGGLILPKDAPEWAGDAARVWREAERAEQTLDRKTGEWRWKKNGQVAKHMTIALPREATVEQRQAMLMEFVNQEIQPQLHGVVVEWAIHRDDNNPHAHLLISTRSLSGDGFGKKARGMNPDFASKGGRHFIGEAENWDNRWASFQSAYFQEHGITAEVRERRAVPEEHYTRGQMKDAQVTAERAAIAQENEAAELARLRDPEKILEQLTAQRAIFTARDVRQALNKSGLEGKEREALEAAITGHADVIPLANARGDEIGWTTRQVRAEEQGIIASAARIGAASGRELGRAGRGKLDAASLLSEQRVAAERITDGRQIGIVIGRAGTGKSFTLGTARQAFEVEGYRVIGLAPTNAVVADLRKDGYSHAATLHRELGQIERGKTRWDSRTVVMVDEAAMIDNAIMGRLLKAAEHSGAKLILAGDDRQFQSVSRGGMFTELVARHGAAELTTVHRQRQAYQARASEDFAKGEMLAALTAYDARGQIVWCDSLEEARAQAVAAQASVEGPGFLYASTNKEVEALNRAEQGRRRAQREAAGEVLQAQSFQTVRGEVSIAAGERVQFYETQRPLGIATSEFGTVRAVAPDRLEITKDDGSTVSFNPAAYDKWGLGYSGTGYKGQGKTQPRTAAVYDNPYAWDSRAAYVIGTRHRDDYQLFVPKELAADLPTLVGQIEKKREDRGASIRFEEIEREQVQQARSGMEKPAARQSPAADREFGEMVAAGKAAARERMATYKQQRVNEAARGMVSEWGQLTSDYRKALPELEKDPTLGGVKERLERFGQSLQAQPEVLKVLRERGAEFGIAEKSSLAQVVADAQPARALAGLMNGAETKMREQLRARAEREAQQNLAKVSKGWGRGMTR
jgi:Ti-type conjugative transfer relaxase TraA